MSNKRKIWVLGIKMEKKKLRSPCEFRTRDIRNSSTTFFLSFITSTTLNPHGYRVFYNLTSIKSFNLIKQNVVRSEVSHLDQMCYSALILEC